MAVAVGAIVATLVILVVFYMLRNLRSHRVKVLASGAEHPEFASDRAYNRLALARREADLLAAQGGDVARARDLIALAESSLRSREFDRAYELAQSAHETLVTARRRQASAGVLGSPSRGPAPVAPLAAAAPILEAPSGPKGEGGVAPPVPPAVPKNRAEAQFQLRLFEEDLVTAKGKDGGAQPSAEARELYVQAQAAFSRGDYGEAFRLALRGRRRVGATVEALAPSPVSPVPPGQPSPSPTDVAAAAERVALADRCPSCGHPISPDDSFCRGCGTARTPTACPKCGASRKAGDAFCGKCGTRYG